MKNHSKLTAPWPRSARQTDLPTSFQDRGAYVPFHNTTLRGSRARLRDTQNGGRIEAVIPAFGGRDGSYVLAWNDLPKMTVLTKFDNNLWHAVGQTSERLSPKAIASIVANMRAQNTLNEEESADLEASRETDPEQKAYAVAQVTAMIADCAPLQQRLGGRSALSRALNALQDTLNSDEITFKEVAYLIDYLASCIMDLEIYGCTHKSSLRRRLATLTTLPEKLTEIRSWLKNDDHDAIFSRIKREAEVSTFFATSAVRANITRFSDLKAIIRAYFDDPLKLDQQISLPYYALDGWDVSLEAINEINNFRATRDMENIKEWLLTAARFLPPLPREVYEHHAAQSLPIPTDAEENEHRAPVGPIRPGRL